MHTLRNPVKHNLYSSLGMTKLPQTSAVQYKKKLGHKKKKKKIKTMCLYVF